MTPPLTGLQRRTIASLEARLERIALLPSVVARLSGLDLGSPTASDEIVALCRCDPPLALRLLRHANSTVCGGGGVTTIPEAINRVGSHSLANAILALSVIEVFVPRSRSQRNLWIHSIQTALVASRMAALRPDLGVTMEECFLAGLLHDIGRFVIFEHRPEDMAQIDESDVDDPRKLIEAEIGICGFDHATLGHEVCLRWRLPETVSEMVRVHHMYGAQKSRIPPEVTTLVRLVQEADCFSFGLLRSPGLGFRSEAELRLYVETSLYPLSAQERIFPAVQLAQELINIDRDARILAGVINIEYPH